MNKETLLLLREALYAFNEIPRHEYRYGQSDTYELASKISKSINGLITWDEFVEKFGPQKNHLNNNASLDGYMFESVGPEMSHVRLVNAVAPDRVWTYIDSDDGATALINGLACINQLGYVITANPADRAYNVIG